MYFKRLIDSYLYEWKKSPHRKPIILRGARQVGKSSAVRQLGLLFDDFIEINFEQNPKFNTVFDGDLSPVLLVEQISVMIGRQIVPGKSLLFFDEVQACPRAVSSLRFFYEQMPSLHVIAAGSLLEFALQELPSYGVGRVRSYYIFPFSYDEFLSALGQDLLLQARQNARINKPLPEAIHQKLLQYLSVFMVTGGMPEAFACFWKKKTVPQATGFLRKTFRNTRTLR